MMVFCISKCAQLDETAGEALRKFYPRIEFWSICAVLLSGLLISQGPSQALVSNRDWSHYGSPGQPPSYKLEPNRTRVWPNTVSSNCTDVLACPFSHV